MQRWSAACGVSGVVLNLLLITGCEKKAPPPPPPPPSVVTVAHPVVREVTDFEEFTGRMQALESVEIRARVGGYLQQIFFQPGTDVKKDEVLFLIDPKPFQAAFDQAQAQVAQAQASLKEQQIEVSRLSELLKTQAASPIESDRAIAQRDAAKAGVEAAKANLEQAQLNLDYTTVRAPIDGRISRNYVDVGNLVMGGQGSATLLTTIVAIDPIFAYFDVDEQTVLRIRQRIREGQMKTYRQADIPVGLGLATDDDFPYQGTIDFVENRLIPETGTLNVRAVFQNKDGALSPGLFARIRLQVGVPYRAILVPERTLGSDQGQRFLLTVNDKHIVESRQVKIGRQQGDWRVILQGIRADEWIITNGLQRVRPGVTVQPRETTIETQPAATQSAASRRASMQD